MFRIIIFTITFGLTSVQIQASDDNAMVALLTDFYQTLNGNDWHNNDGWLDSDTHYCDWYGVNCLSQGPDESVVSGLSLEDNNLHGKLPGELLDALGDETGFYLKGNFISGELDYLPTRPRLIDLSFNRLDGPLPAFIPNNSSSVHLERLRLSGNGFSGSVPAGWQDLTLNELFLADNELNSGHIYAFRAMSRDGNSRLDLTGNRFNGELGIELYSSNLMRRDRSNFSGGLGLCFNAFTISNPDVLAWVDDRHFGGIDPERCLEGVRQEIDTSVSGSWYDPERSGEGLSIMLMENGLPLVYQFSFDTEGRQQWLFEVGRASKSALHIEGLLETRGQFGQGLHYFQDLPLLRPTSQLRLDRTGDDQLYNFRFYYDLLDCGPFEYPPGIFGYPCIPSAITDRLNYQRLTELAGTRCDNQSRYQAYSGVWYSPERNGEGFVIEALPDDRGVVYWFTYAADGSGQQAWMTGDGLFGFGGVMVDPPPPTVPLTIEQMLMPTSGQYGPDFDPEAVELINWGQLDIEFLDDDQAQVTFDSLVDDYGSDSYPIERLAIPMLADCED